MKLITGFLVGTAILLSGVAGAQYYSQASVSGQVLSEGPQGFMLEGPDGNYGIVIAPTTVVADSWNTLIGTGAGNVVPGDFVTATGYPMSQWIMRASRVVVRNANPPVLYPGVGGSGTFFNGTFQMPRIQSPLQQRTTPSANPRVFLPGGSGTFFNGTFQMPRVQSPLQQRTTPSATRPVFLPGGSGTFSNGTFQMPRVQSPRR